MINNIAGLDTRISQPVAKATTSHLSNPLPPVLGFKLPQLKKKAELRVKKFKRSDNLIIVGDIDEHYVDIVEEDVLDNGTSTTGFNFFNPKPDKKKTKYLKNCYIIDYIHSPIARQGLGTQAIKSLAEKAMFDPKAEGRIVTFSAPVHKESSPAQFFYKLGFRFFDLSANEYIEECIRKKVPDSPPQTGMMYLPKANLHRLLRYGDLF